VYLFDVPFVREINKEADDSNSIAGADHLPSQVRVYSTERRLDLVEDGIDVALRVGAITPETMVARHVLTYRHVLVASPKLIQRLGKPADTEALRRLPCGMWASIPRRDGN
jgi:DNA-binding transcriptional LysR family regulator